MSTDPWSLGLSRILSLRSKKRSTERRHTISSPSDAPTSDSPTSDSPTSDVPTSDAPTPTTTPSAPSSPTSSGESEAFPHHPEAHAEAWDIVLSTLRAHDLLVLRATCRGLRDIVDTRIASHAIFYGDGIHHGLDVVWTAHARISLMQRPDLWSAVRVLDITGSCDCGADWTPHSQCMCLQSLGVILDHILPGPVTVECVRVHMRNFRVGAKLEAKRLRVRSTVYVLDLYPARASILNLPLAPIGGSKEVFLSIHSDPCSRWVQDTDFLSHDHDPNTHYAVEFTPAPAPRLPAWYGAALAGSHLSTKRHYSGRIAWNLLAHFAGLAASQPGRGRLGAAGVHRWPGGWFVPDIRTYTTMASYEGQPWVQVAPRVADSIFTCKFVHACGIKLDGRTNASEYFARAGARFILIQYLIFTSCLCGCRIEDHVPL